MQVRYQAAPRPDRGSKCTENGAGWPPLLTTQELEHVLEFCADLADDLLALREI